MSPALMVVASAVLSVDTSAHSTVMVVGGPEVPEPSFVVVKLAWLDSVPLGHGAVAAVVGLVMWTWLTAPAARVVGPKLSVVPVMDQPTSECAVSMVQSRPGLVGRGSVTVTPVAVPVPLLVTVML